MLERTNLWAPRNLMGCSVKTATTARERDKVIEFQTETYMALDLLPAFPPGSYYKDQWADDSVYFYLEDLSSAVIASCRLTMPEFSGSPFFEYGQLHPHQQQSLQTRPRTDLCEIGGFALPMGRDSITAAAHLVRAALQFSIGRGRYSWVALVNPPTHKLFTTRFGAHFSVLGDLQEMRPVDVDVRHTAMPVEFDLLHYLATGRSVSDAVHNFMTEGLVIDLREPAHVF